jgi:glycerol-3-phosphate dehydrogenase
LLLEGAPGIRWEQFVSSEPKTLRAEFGVSESLAVHLVNRYGRRAKAVATVIRERGEDQPVAAGEPDVLGEWAYQRDQETALTRADHLLRRSRIGMWHEQLLAE